MIAGSDVSKRNWLRLGVDMVGGKRREQTDVGKSIRRERRISKISMSQIMRQRSSILALVGELVAR